MGNEASLEGGAQQGESGSMMSMPGVPGSGPPGSGQHIKPVNGAAAGGGMVSGGPGMGMNRSPVGSPKPGVQQGYEGGGAGGGRPGEPYRLATHESPSPRQMQSSPGMSMVQGPASGSSMVSGQGPGPGMGGHSPGMGHGPGTGGSGQSPGQHASRRNLQVDFSSSGSRTGRSPSVSPDLGSAPTSPYSVPHLAPMPTCKLCPLCTTTELTNLPAMPNYNTCTQCHSTVCNQCGFNPNPHLTEVQEWLCLNCQMQRALGIDMTTPRSKSQQQIHSPSHQAKAIVQPQPVQPAQPKPQPQAQPQAQRNPHPQAQPQSHAHPQAQPKSQPYSKPQAQSQSQSYPQAQPQSYSHPYSQSQPQPYSQQQPQTYPQQQSQAYPYPHSQTQPYPQSQPQPDPQSQDQPKLQPQAQSQASAVLQRHPGAGGAQTQAGSSAQAVRDPYSQRGTGGPEGPWGLNQAAGPHIPHPGAIPLPGMAKAPSQPDLGRGSPLHNVASARQYDHTRSAGSSPAHRVQGPPPAQDGLTKLFGFGASLLNQASTLINVDPLPTASTQPSPARGKVVFSNASSVQQQWPPSAKPFQMRGPHAPTQIGGPHAPTQMGSHQMGGPHASTQMDVPQMDGPHAPAKMGGPQRGGPHVPQMGGPQMVGPHAPVKMGGPQMGGPHTPAQIGGPQMDGPHAQSGGPQLDGPHGLAQKQQITSGQFPVQHQKEPPQQQKQQQGSPFKPQQQGQQQQAASSQRAPEPEKPKINCPLCKTELNIGSSETPNYNSCTQCHTQVCNLCGFNPTPHLVEKKEWLCLNCQTQRLMSGAMEDMPIPRPTSKHQAMGSPRHQTPASQQSPLNKATNQQQQGPKPTQAQGQQQKGQTGPLSGTGMPTAAKQAGNNQTSSQSTPSLATEPPRGQKPMEDKPKLDKEAEKSQPTKEPKPQHKKGEQITSIKEIKKSRHYDDTKNNSSHDLSRSPQSQSDTGYSSDGISSSHSEITGLIQEEEIKLSERGISGHTSPTSPSEITKLESSMKPLLEKSLSEETVERVERRGRKHRDREGADRRGQRPRSLSITPEAYDSDEELEDILEEEEDGGGGDWETKRKEGKEEKNDKKEKKPTLSEMTDEEFMRRQILEMSADEDIEEEDEEEEDDMEDEEDEGYGYQKPKKSHHKHSISDSAKEKRRLTHLSSSFEEETKSSSDIYKGSAEEGEEDSMASQGGLRRFKTIELNNTSSYNPMDLSAENDDLSLDREPELEMESLTGSPEERSRGDYSSTLPPTSSSYTSGQSPTSISSMEEDSDSSPSRRQRLEEAKQQRKARHRSHGPLLPTIEDSSEEDELREEEELLREQEKMRDLEQQRIRSTARKTKRDKEELRAQRRRERSKTPPSNLSPIEDASPTEELRQAAEMEELHRSSASEYSPQSLDSEAEGYESKLYKSGSEYNLPTFMSLYSPTEKSSTTTTTMAPSSSSKPLKSAEEVYEEMMRKAEMLQKQQKHQQQQQQPRQGQQYYEEDVNGQGYEDDYEYEQDQAGCDEAAKTETDIYEEIRQTSQNITKMQQQSDDQVEIEIESYFPEKQLLDTGSAFAKLLEQSNALLTPGTSPTQLSAPVSFAETGSIPDVRVTQHFATKNGHKDRIKSQTGKNGITPVAAATTIAAYGVYSRDAVTISQTSSTHSVTTTQSTMYGRLTGGPTTSTATVSNVCSKIAEITQAYSQREVVARRVGECRGVQVRESATSSSERIIEPRSPLYSTYYRSTSPPLSPSPPNHSPTHSSSRRGTSEFSTQTLSSEVGLQSAGSGPTSPVMATGTQTPTRSVSPRLYRQHSSQDVSYSQPTSPRVKPMTVNTATSPLSSPTQFSRQSTFDSYSPGASPPDTPPYRQSPTHSFYRTQRVEKVNVGTSMVTTASTYSRGSMSMDNISLCRISSVPGTSRVEQGHMIQGGSVVDLRTATKPAPIIMTDQGMDLTSVATEYRRYQGGAEGSPIRHSTTVQPLIMNLNAQEHTHHVIATTPTTVSVTVAASMFMSTQPKHPTVYGDPHQNRVELGQSMSSAMCLSQNKPPTDSSIPKIDAKLEDLSLQQQELQRQQQKLQQQQELLEQQLQQHHQMQQQQVSTLSRYNLLLKKDLLVTQTSNAPAVVSAIAPDQYRTGGAVEVTGQCSTRGHVMMVQVDEGTTQGGPQTQLMQVDEGVTQGGPQTQIMQVEEGQDVMNLTGHQIKPESQLACCDVVYHLPFGGSCVGTLEREGVRAPTVPPLSHGYESDHEGRSQYHECPMDGQKTYTLPFPGRLQPSLSDTNLAESYHSKLDPHLQASGELAVDLTSMKHTYEGGIMGIGMQYGSYTDLRHGGEVTAQLMPIRRFNSLSNISSDYGYSPRDLANFQDANLAQYSATTAREISRMCAALNSMDRYGSNPELMQYGSLGRGSGIGSRLPAGLAGMRPNLLYGADGKPLSHGQALSNLINARQASLRAMYPSAVRSSDGMIYSTINTPIASTLPITTQPTSVMRPLLRGVYRPLPSANMTAVPLASLSRLPLNPRMPLGGQAQFRFPAPRSLPPTMTTATAVLIPPVSSIPPLTTIAVQDKPVFLGKIASMTPTPPLGQFAVTLAGVPSEPGQQPINLSQAHLNTQIAGQQQQHLPQQQSVQQPQQSQLASAYTYTPSGPLQSQGPPSSGLPPFPPPGASHPEGETEEETLHRQQEQLLQLERERVELEKLRQLQIQEDLERERMELKLHREKEQMLVHREIQELQTIKEQVLHQQQAERENQLVMQREQLSQQKAQLDQIQSLQQQLQQQLEEQKRQKTLIAAAAIQNMQADMNVQIYGESGMGGAPSRPLPNSSSDICLRTQEEHYESRSSMRKHSSMTRLRDSMDGESIQFYGARRIVDSCVQTDDEDGEERYMMRHRSRRRGRSIDCSVQTDDDEDKVEWEQPVRRRRSRFSRHAESTATSNTNSTTTETKADISKTASSSIAIQTIRDGSCQTEVEHLERVSPTIHVTVPDPNKVEIIHYISGPERTQKGQSLACQTDPEAQSQGVVAPQLNVPTTVSPYCSSSTGTQLVCSTDPLTQRQLQQNVANAAKFERRRPDPLEINYQSHNHLHSESISSLIRQQHAPPKSPQVLYSPVSPVSPHRLLENSLSSERLNKAHVTPQQKSYTAESPQRHPSMPRPMKSTQRSMSDPKSLSPTTDEHTKARLSLYQHQALQNQLAALQQSSLLRKVKRTLPSPPPEETTTSVNLPMMTPTLPQVYMPSLSGLKPGSRSGLAAKASLLKDLTHELKAVEQESTKLRKQQAELEEEEKEIDAKLRYLELGIHQRKETLVKERERRDIAYLRCMGDARDYMSDSELNNLRLAAAAASFESNGLLTARPSTAPLSHFTSDLNTAAQYPPTSSFTSYQYHQSQPVAPSQPSSAPYQSGSFNQPPYPTVSQSQALPQPTPLQSHDPPPLPSYQTQTYPPHTYPPNKPPYPQTDLGNPLAPQPQPPQPQPGHTGFGPAPPGQPPYPTHGSPYPTAASAYPSQSTPYPGQPQAEILTVHHRPRQSNLADLEHKLPTNYEVISNPTVVVTTTTQDATYSSGAPSYGQYSGTVTMANSYGPYSAPVSTGYGGYSTTPASTYGQYTSTPASTYGQYTAITANTYGYTTTASSYGQYTPTVKYGHAVDSPVPYATGDGIYGGGPGLEQSIPRNYVMIDDISELTAKDGLGTTAGEDIMLQGEGSHGGRYPGEVHHGGSISGTGSARSSGSYGRADEEQEELYDHQGRAYHLGQEETDWFEKPRSRHYGSSSHSSGRSRHAVKHTYHDYNEPPEEDLWPQDEYGHTGGRHSTSRDQRHHGSSSRHSSSRHSDDPRSSRSSRSSKDPSVRHESRQMSSSGKRGDSRSGGYRDDGYSRDQTGHHHSQRTSKQGSHHQPGSSRSKSQQGDLQGHPQGSGRSGNSSSRGQGSTSGPLGSGRHGGPGSQQDGSTGQRTQLQQQVQTQAARQGQPVAGTNPQQQPTAQGQGLGQGQVKTGQMGHTGLMGQMGVPARQPQAGPQPVTATKIDTPPVMAIGAKAVPGAQAAKTPQPPLTGIGSKAAPRPGGIGSAAAGQPGMEGDSFVSKILPGAAAEQAGKLGEAISGFGKKFTSFF